MLPVGPAWSGDTPAACGETSGMPRALHPSQPSPRATARSHTDNTRAAGSSRVGCRVGVECGAELHTANPADQAAMTAPLQRVVAGLPESSAVRFFKRAGDDCWTVTGAGALLLADTVRSCEDGAFCLLVGCCTGLSSRLLRRYLNPGLSCGRWEAGRPHQRPSLSLQSSTRW